MLKRGMRPNKQKFLPSHLAKTKSFSTMFVSQPGLVWFSDQEKYTKTGKDETSLLSLYRKHLHVEIVAPAEIDLGGRGVSQDFP